MVDNFFDKKSRDISKNVLNLFTFLINFCDITISELGYIKNNCSINEDDQ